MPATLICCKFLKWAKLQLWRWGIMTLCHYVTDRCFSCFEKTKKSELLKRRIDGSFVVLRVGGHQQAAGALMAEYLIPNLNTLRAPSLVCVLCCCWQYQVDSTSGIIAGPQYLSPPPGYTLCTISCSLGRKRPATVLSYCQSLTTHHLAQSAHIHHCFLSHVQ